MIALEPRAEHHPGLVRAAWALDLIVWVAIIGGGFVMLGLQSPAVSLILGTAPILLAALAGLWIVGGTFGFVVRFLQLGILEIPALGAGIASLTSYEAIVLFAWASHGVQGLMAASLTVIGIAALTRRLVVLRALGSEPGETTIPKRLHQWVRRATT